MYSIQGVSEEMASILGHNILRIILNKKIYINNLENENIY